jgi:hypothetical protein
MSHKLHRNGSWNARALQIAHCCPPEIMRNPSYNAGILHGAPPCSPETQDALAFAMKYPRDDFSLLPLKTVRALTLGPD